MTFVCDETKWVPWRIGREKTKSLIGISLKVPLAGVGGASIGWEKTKSLIGISLKVPLAGVGGASAGGSGPGEEQDQHHPAQGTGSY